MKIQNSQPQSDTGQPVSAPLSAARLGAVQALYQMDMAGTDLNDIVSEFTLHRLGLTLEDFDLAEADEVFFADLLQGVVSRQTEIDPIINASLAKGWRLTRIDSILRAILRSGAYELLARPDVPARVVINEYIDIAHAFFEKHEPKVVNGILDKLARELRADEFETQNID